MDAASTEGAPGTGGANGSPPRPSRPIDGSDYAPTPAGGRFVPASEADLVAHLRAGDNAAYEYVLAEVGGRMLATARRMLPNEDDARDAVQDAFLSAFRALDRFDGSSKFTTWLHRILINACLMKLRTKRRRPERSIEDLMPKFYDDGHAAFPAQAWGVTAEAAAADAETKALVRASIEELPEDYRTVLVLRDIEELDTEETAQVLGLTVSAVKTRLHRARIALRELLDTRLRSGRDGQAAGAARGQGGGR